MDSFYSYADRGNVKILLGDFIGAIKDFDIAIQLKPDEKSFYSDRGYAYIKIRNYVKAIEDLNQSLNIAPSQKAFTNLGLLIF